MSVFEFRGVDNLVYAEILTDTNTEGGFTFGEVKPLSPVAEIGKTVETSAVSKYYDNVPMMNINSEGADEIQMTVAPLDMKTLADITGKGFDEETGMFVDGVGTPKYFAVGYRTKGTDGQYRYVWRLKGTFGIPEEVSATEDDGTDSNNQTLTFTGITTTHKFTKGMYEGGKWVKAGVKGIVVDTRLTETEVTPESFFATVQTPDTFGATA